MRVELRGVTEWDLPLLLAWAWMPKVWKYLPTSRENENLTWERHWSWWRDRKNRLDLIIRVEENAYWGRWRPVGVIHLTDMDLDFPEVGLYLGEVGLWGMGIGGGALKQVIVRASLHKYDGLHAVIHPSNKRSVRLFTGQGFRKVGKARKGQRLYELDLRTISRSESPIPQPQRRDQRSYQPSPV